MYIIPQNIKDIIEVTYIYDVSDDKNTYYNQTLFDDFMDTSECKTYDEYYGLVGGNLQTYIQKYQSLCDTNHHDSAIEEIQCKYMGYVADMLRLAYIGLPFEIQKMGIETPLTELEISERIGKLEDIEQKRFGKKVCEDPLEVEVAYQSLQGIVGGQDNDIYTAYIQTLEGYRGKIDGPVGCIYTGESAFLKKMKEIQISREVYIQMFDLTMQLYGMQRSCEIKELSSMYDATEALYIPDDEKYAQMSIYDVLKLVKHEIETHYVVLENNKTLLGSYESRGANNLFKEEGLAIFNEVALFATVEEQVFEKQCGASLNLVLQNELLTGQEFLELRAYTRGETEHDHATMLRYKRNHSLYHPGSQHKDVSYRRGRNQVIDYIQGGRDYAALYLAKVDLEDTKILEKEISDEMKEGLLYPKFLADRLLLDIERSYIGVNPISRDEFSTYIYEKYSYVDFDNIYFGPYTHQEEDIYSKLLSLFIQK